MVICCFDGLEASCQGNAWIVTGSMVVGLSY